MKPLRLILQTDVFIFLSALFSSRLAVAWTCSRADPSWLPGGIVWSRWSARTCSPRLTTTSWNPTCCRRWRQTRFRCFVPSWWGTSVESLSSRRTVLLGWVKSWMLCAEIPESEYYTSPGKTRGSRTKMFVSGNHQRARFCNNCPCWCSIISTQNIKMKLMMKKCVCYLTFRQL